jgi:hypothetical protein
MPSLRDDLKAAITDTINFGPDTILSAVCSVLESRKGADAIPRFQDSTTRYPHTGFRNNQNTGFRNQGAIIKDVYPNCPPKDYRYEREILVESEIAGMVIGTGHCWLNKIHKEYHVYVKTPQKTPAYVEKPKLSKWIIMGDDKSTIDRVCCILEQSKEKAKRRSEMDKERDEAIVAMEKSQINGIYDDDELIPASKRQHDSD